MMSDKYTRLEEAKLTRQLMEAKAEIELLRARVAVAENDVAILRVTLAQLIAVAGGS